MFEVLAFAIGGMIPILILYWMWQFVVALKRIATAHEDIACYLGMIATDSNRR